MDEEFLRTGTYEGDQYAVPMGRGITGYAYDSKIYTQAGLPTLEPDSTWEDWATPTGRSPPWASKAPTDAP